MSEISVLETNWRIDLTKCNGCGDCVVICPVGALRVKSKVATMVSEVNCCRESCRICEYHCPKDAIRAY